jgi:hypothetical protein
MLPAPAKSLAGGYGASASYQGSPSYPAVLMAPAGKQITYSPTYQYMGEDPQTVAARDRARFMDTLAVYN